jgi:hypothetical protein
MEVLTPIPLILQQLFADMKTRYTGSDFKFDPNLEYVESVGGLRSLRHSLDISEANVFPLFVFNRTNLVPIPDFNRRFIPMKKDLNLGTAIKYYMKILQCDIMFKVFSDDVIFADTFEIMYASVESVNKIKSFTVDLPEIGAFEYYIEWSPLDETEYNKTDNLYISKSFKGTLKGSFFVVDENETTLNLISAIHAKILDFHNLVLSDLTIS